MASKQRRPTLFVIYPGVALLDVIGPLEILMAANELPRLNGRAPQAVYSTLLASVDGKPVRASSGVALQAERSLAALRGPLDALVVPGAFGIDAVLDSKPLIRQIQRLAKRARRVVSVCSGTFLLAEAGLLDGRRVTTHWAGCRKLAARYPKVKVEDDPIFVRDGRVYTSAGVTAGMDLALALVEEDLGRPAALELARWFVMYLKRPGGQSQFSAHLQTQLGDREPIRETLSFIANHLSADLSVPALARRARMSPRHFARVFQHEVGSSPGKHVARVRIEAARRRLEESKDPLKLVAASCGFGTLESLRRSFNGSLSVTPGDYRARFRGA